MFYEFHAVLERLVMKKPRGYIRHKVRYESASAVVCIFTSSTSNGEKIAEVSDVWAGEKRKGHATEVMRKICEMADAMGLTLLLSPRSEDLVYGPTQDKLESWYESFGFIMFADNPKSMARKPIKGSDGDN